MYESFYNFTESPFRLTPDPRFYFSSATHKRALTHLRFGFHQREGFVVITGKPGTGKTELMLHLLEGLPQDRITYGKIVTSNLDANEILQQVAAAFRIPAEGIKKGILLKKLEDVFLQHVRENKRLVLIVDEAHKLSVNSLNELQMLTNFQLSGKAALQCFLSGHDNLKINLHNPELLHLKQRVITSTFLMPLEKQETQEYIEHRLRCVGWEGDPKFNLSAYHLIHDTTEGTPRQINALCNRILLRAYSEQKHYIDESIVSRAIDDVASEPLASNLAYPHLMSEITDGDGFQDSSRRISQPPVVNQFVGEQEPATHDDVDATLTYPYNDQDETLPLPSAVNGVAHPAARDSAVREASWSMTDHDFTVLRRNQVVRPSYGSTLNTDRIRTSLDENDKEIIDEARKMSDALSDFHNETASKSSNLKIPPQNSGQKFHIVPDSQSALTYIEKRSSDINRKTKSRKVWVAPLAYGSAALFLMAIGVFLWMNKFPNNFVDPTQAKGSMDDTLVAAIKGMLPDDQAASRALGSDSRQIENQSEIETTTTALSNPNQSVDPAEIASDQPVTTTSDVKAQQDEWMQSVDVESAVDQWDSGALGGQFLTQQAEQPPPLTEEQVAANDVPVSEIKSQANLSHNTKPEGKQTADKELIVAGVANAPNEIILPALIPAQAPKTTGTKTQPKTSSANKNKKPAQSTAKAVKSPADAAVASESKQKVQDPPATTQRAAIAKVPAAIVAAPGVSPNKTDMANPSQALVVEDGAVPAGGVSAQINKTQLNELLARLTSAYENGNLNQLLSVLSNDVRSNDGATRRDLKNGYRKLFNITDMRKMTITSVNWSKKDRLVRGEGEFELFVREKGADTVTSYGGVISLEVDDRAEGAVITRLNYDYKN